MDGKNVQILLDALDDAKFYLESIRGAVWWRDGETLMTSEKLCAKIDLAIATARANDGGITL